MERAEASSKHARSILPSADDCRADSGACSRNRGSLSRRSVPQSGPGPCSSGTGWRIRAVAAFGAWEKGDSVQQRLNLLDRHRAPLLASKREGDDGFTLLKDTHGNHGGPERARTGESALLRCQQRAPVLLHRCDLAVDLAQIALGQYERKAAVNAAACATRTRRSSSSHEADVPASGSEVAAASLPAS